MPLEMLERLRMDPGSRTLGELLQERQWAIHEIERLRDAATRRETKGPSLPSVANTVAPVKRDAPSDLARGTSIAPDAQLLRLSDVIGLIGLSRSTIYMKIARNRFPAGVRIGDRARRWRLSDIKAWQADLDSEG